MGKTDRTHRMNRSYSNKIIRRGAKELRDYEPTEEEVSSVKRNDIFIIVDNVLDTYNVGSIFRLADAVAARKVFLVGETDAPDNPKVGHKIQKASVGTWRWVPWEHVRTVASAVRKLKAKSLKRKATTKKLKQTASDINIKIIAIEQGEGSVDYRKAKIDMPVALIVGHETRGVSKEGLGLADIIVELPMFGVNKSLNVLVALAIVCYKILEA